MMVMMMMMMMLMLMVMTLVSQLQAYIAVIIGLRTKNLLKICARKYVKLWNDTNPASEYVCYVAGQRQAGRPSSDSTRGANTSSSV
jgi:hypothetical protein